MKSQSFVFGILAVTVFLAGVFLPTSAESKPQPSAPGTFLTELHLHGSLSEGRATMWHHSEAGSNAGYDVLWWTDHMERITSEAFPQSLDFDSGLFSGAFDLGLLGFKDTGSVTNSLVPSGGGFYAEINHASSVGSTSWTSGGLKFWTTGNLHRMSLMADPRIELKLRLSNVPDPSDASVIIRIRLSSRRGNGLTEEGIPNIIEYIPQGMPFPTPLVATNTLQVSTPALNTSSFTTIVLNPQGDVSPFFYEGDDLSIIRIDVLAAARNGKFMVLDMDDYSLNVPPSQSNKSVLVAAEDRVKNSGYPYDLLTQYVGMEMAGPDEGEMTDISTRDHVIALYRDPIGAAINQIYNFKRVPPTNWPEAGIDSVHNDGGVAILAHIFGATSPPNVLPNSTLKKLAKRVIVNRAWGADGIEIGYEVRGASIDIFLSVWDKLSKRRTYITGVGVSDNHNVLDWDLSYNHMATWLKAPTNSAPNLADAVHSGHAFFGDPFRFDSASGELTFREVNGAFRMGNVVPIVPGASPTLGVHIKGAQAGDELVWFLNGVEAIRSPFPVTGEISDQQAFTLNPGNWVRVEVRTSADKIYLLSNPIYFVGQFEPIPLHRTP